MFGKVVVISGCSSGIGLATAVTCLKRGARVFAGLRVPARQSAALKAAATAQAVSDETVANNLNFIQLDVASDDSVRDAVESVTGQTDNTIDYLINNAGEGLNGTIETIPLERAKQHFDINVWGAYRMVQQVAPVMRRQGTGGHILNISSASAYRSLPGFEIYGAGKFALDGLMQGYAGIAALDKVSVTNVQPGPIATEFVTRLRTERTSGDSQTPAPEEVEDESDATLLRGLRNLAQFNEDRLAQATLTGYDVAAVVADLIEQHAESGKVPLSVPVGDPAKQVQE